MKSDQATRDAYEEGRNAMYAINHLPLRSMAKSITGCCPPFDPAEWDGQTFTFVKKPFLRFTTRSFFHIPVNMDKKMREVMAKVEQAGATSPEYLMLSEEISPWKTQHHLAVSKEMPGSEMEHLSGIYLAKVFEGPYQNMRQWYEKLIAYTKSEGKKPLKTYFNYTMCPNCAKAYGHNYVVGFEQVA